MKKKKSRYTEAQAKASKKYLGSLAMYQIRMSEETKNKIKECANLTGKSMNQFILDAVHVEISKICNENETYEK